MQQFDDICIMVGQFATMKNCWGEDVQRYYAVDIQDNEVIVVDRQDGYRYYGFSFSVNGDKPEINFDNKLRKKISYENYEDGASYVPEGAFNFGKHIADIEKTAFAKVNEAEAKVAEAETKIDEANTAAKTAETDYAKSRPNMMRLSLSMMSMSLLKNVARTMRLMRRKIQSSLNMRMYFLTMQSFLL